MHGNKHQGYDRQEKTPKAPPDILFESRNKDKNSSHQHHQPTHYRQTQQNNSHGLSSVLLALT